MARNAQTITVAGLARFFPDASPVRMRFQLARIIPGSAPAAASFTESIAVEFGTSSEVLFACNTALEFGDDLRLRNSDGSFDVTASVVAAHYSRGDTGGAAPCREEVPDV